jgi:hypothetical protein
MCPAGPLSGRQAQAALRASTTSFLAEAPRGRRAAHQITRSGVSRRRASCTHCAVSKPSRSSGISRCPPSARLACIATLITFGSISAVVLRVQPPAPRWLAGGSDRAQGRRQLRHDRNQQEDAGHGETAEREPNWIDSHAYPVTHKKTNPNTAAPPATASEIMKTTESRVFARTEERRCAVDF